MADNPDDYYPGCVTLDTPDTSCAAPYNPGPVSLERLPPDAFIPVRNFMSGEMNALEYPRAEPVMASDSFDQDSMRAQLKLAVKGLAAALNAIYYNPFIREIETMEQLFAGHIQHRIVLFDTGSHAMEQWRHGDEIHVVCLSQMFESTFWDVVKEELKLKDDFKQPKEGCLELSAHGLARIQGAHAAHTEIIKLCHMSNARCKLFLHWTKMPADFCNILKDHRDFPTSPGRQSEAADDSFVMVRDTQSLAHRMRPKGGPKWKDRAGVEWGGKSAGAPWGYMPSFTLAYCILRRWALTNGLYGLELGYLDDETLLWTIYAAVDEKEGVDLNLSFGNLEKAFSAIGDTYEAPIDIRSPTGELSTTQLTPSAKRSIHTAILRGTHVPGPDDEYIAPPNPTGLQDFLAEYSSTLFLVDCEKTTQAPAQLDRLRRQLIQRVVALEPLLREWKDSRGVGGLYVRIWPDLLVEKGRQDRWVYAFGVGRSPPLGEEEGKYLSGCVAGIADFLREKAPEHDWRAGLIEVRVASKEDFAALLPERVVQTGAFSTAAPGDALPEAPGTSGKFSSARQAIGRLRHDPRHAGREYDVGYEDRFEGLQWVALEEWGGKETEEEEWIPEHRVRQLRRRGDGVVMWDREKRLDLLG
ncbi:uncharacterized protein LTR77_008717 [Saxophila tyrrhenica]|uniref:MJ1316 RNA cyclic group end recognition domain-containing protein n=1 Tax=Saxophila tyrrhenica TaxID=1690608 RepID=A0AAV9P451_9PEZI|nr:hypothetical protein LTR77_008717 [Saxophila tyrrhenica]